MRETRKTEPRRGGEPTLAELRQEIDRIDEAVHGQVDVPLPRERGAPGLVLRSPQHAYYRDWRRTYAMGLGCR